MKIHFRIFTVRQNIFVDLGHHRNSNVASICDSFVVHNRSLLSTSGNTKDQKKKKRKN